MTEQAYLQQAIRLAEESVRSGGGPFAALVVRDGEVIGRGTNCVTHDNDPTAHAEVQAIRDACQHIGDFRLAGSTLYVNCEPCPMCLAAAYWARLERVVYAASAEDAATAGFDDVLIRRELALPVGDRRLPMQQLLRGEALKVFELWLSQEDRINY